MPPTKKKGRSRPRAYKVDRDGNVEAHDADYDGDVTSFFSGRARKVQIMPKGLTSTVKKLAGRFRGHVDRTWGETSREHHRRDLAARRASARESDEEELHGQSSGRTKAARWAARSSNESLETFEAQQRTGKDWGRARPAKVGKLHGHARGKTCPKCRT